MSCVLPDLPDVDWSNPDVQRVLDMLGWKYEQKCKENAEMKRVIAEKDTRIAEQDTRIAELEALVEDLKGGGAGDAQEAGPARGGDAGRSGRRNPRKYNAREYKDYPKVDGAPRTREYLAYDGGLDFSAVISKSVQRTADILVCPVHGTPLSEKVTETYSRTTRDAVIGGGWCVTHWTVNRRYCRKCRGQHTAQPEGVLPGEHYGTNIMAIISILRNLIISFESIQKIILMVYGRFINMSAPEKLYDTVSDRCRPLYDEFMDTMKDSDAIRGDHTGWFLIGKRFHALVIISRLTALYHFAPTKGGMVMESIMQDYGGIVLSDSDASWNSIGELWQKCLLHYFRNIEDTLSQRCKDKGGSKAGNTADNNAGNTGKEFEAFARELKLILKRAIDLGKIHGDEAVPERLVGRLEKRIGRLIKGEYSDRDCIRFVKRLRREASHLLTFLRYDIEFHNNTSDRALRPVARMRQFLYGSRSERGLKTTETMLTICTTCEMRRINPYHFLIDYLDGRIDAIPKPPDTADKDAAAPAAPAAA